MKPSLEQSTLVAVQRLSGALIGGVAAALLLLIPASEHGLRLFAISRGLEVVALVLLMHAVAIRFWNYALYCAVIAAGVLILIDLPQPSNYAAEGYRLLWTLCGAGIGLLVVFLAGLFAKHTTKAPPQRTFSQPERAPLVQSSAWPVCPACLRSPPLSLPAYPTPQLGDFLWTAPLALVAALAVWAIIQLGAGPSTSYRFDRSSSSQRRRRWSACWP